MNNSSFGYIALALCCMQLPLGLMLGWAGRKMIVERGSPIIFNSAYSKKKQKIVDGDMPVPQKLYRQVSSQTLVDDK